MARVDVSVVGSWLVRRGGGWRRLGVVGVVASLWAALLVVLPPVAGFAAGGGARARVSDRSVAVSTVKRSAVSSSATPVWRSAGVVWPSAGSAVVDLAVDESGQRRGAAVVAGLPVSVSVPARGGGGGAAGVAPATGSGLSRVRVQVLDRGLAGRTGTALLVKLARADGVAGDVSVRVRLGYGGFRQAVGGDWANRLGLVRLPGCAVLTPAVADCWVSEPLASTNDTRSGTVSADVTLTVGATTADIPYPGKPLLDGSAVVALTAGPSGATGDYSHTSLSQTGSWAAGGSSGGFSWSYPITVAPVPGGLKPDISLGYSSAAVDGQTANNNVQPSWVGEGFSYEPGFIERAYRPCAQDDTISPVWVDGLDVCWRMANATLSWNGHTTELIADDASPNPNTAVPTVWHLADDDATKVEYLADTGSSITLNWHDERWRLTAKDGTQYYFGLSKLPGSTIATNSVFGEPVVSNTAGEPCFSATSLNASWCSMAYRWSLDYVVDAHGNSIVYYYARELNLAHKPGNNTATATYDRGGVLARIEYGLRAGAEATSTAPARVLFTTANRCLTGSCGTHDAANWPDTPWDLSCSAGPCPAPSFFSTLRLSSIATQVWTGSGSTYRGVDSYALTHLFPAVPSPQQPVLWLSAIARSGQDSGTGIAGGSVAVPAVSFTAVATENRALADPASGAPFATKMRIARIDTEAGGQILVGYTAAQSNCVFPSAPPNPDNNYRWCFPQEYQGSFTWWHKYLVTSVTEHDAVGGSADVVHAYSYATTATIGGQSVGTASVLWGHDKSAYATRMEHRGWSRWAGYPTVTTVTGPVSGPRSKTTTIYYTGLHADRTDAGDNTRVVTLSDTEGSAGPDYFYLGGRVRETVTFDGDTATVLAKTVDAPVVVHTLSRTVSDTWVLSAILDAYMVNTAQETTRTWLAASGTWRTAQTGFTYDSFDALTATDAAGDTATTADDTCTSTTFARNNTANLRRFNGTGPSAVASTPVVVAADWSGYNPTFPAGDFNNDGKRDVIARKTADGSLWLFPGDGSGGFASAVNLGSGWNAFTRIFSPGDFTGDGKPDVLATKPDSSIWRFTNTGGALSAGVQFAGLGWAAYDVFSPGDFSGDGKGDVLARNNTNGTLWMWTGTGAGTVNAGVQIAGSGWDAYSQVFGWGDISGDTKTDLLAADNAGLWLYVGTGNGGMNARIRMSTGLIGLDSSWFIAAGDVTGDAKPDVFARQSRYLANPVSTVHTVGVACTATPAYPGDAVADARFYYDQPGSPLPSLTALPIVGDVTRTEVAKGYTGATPNWIPGGDTVYDGWGRATTTVDPLGKSTTASYTQTNGLTTSMVVTYPLGHQVATTFAVGRGVPVTVTDPNAKMTTASYDALGRLLKVWKPGHLTSGTPDVEYAYGMTKTAPPFVSTKALGPAGQQITSYELFDGLLRARQSQTPTANGGRSITDTVYDGRGLVAKTSMLFNASPPGSTLVSFADTAVDSQHRYTYDGAGRPVTDQLWSLGSSQFTVTTTSYDGDRVTVDNAAGGTDTTTITDALGRTTALWQYQASTPTGAHDTTSYGYDHAGNLIGLTGPDGAAWSYSYDLLQRRTGAVDPDAGTASSVYDDAGRVTSTTDGRGQTLITSYDDLGRISATYAGSIAPANQLTARVYDTVALGELSSTTRYIGGAAGSAYTQSVTGYDNAYRPTHTTLSIPAAEGALAGAYTTDYTYNTNGTPATATSTTRSGAAVGGLPAETLTYSYNTVGQPIGLAGTQTYLADTSYHYDAQLAQQILGTPGVQIRRTYTPQTATRRLGTDQVDTEHPGTPGTFDDRSTTTYTYQPAGNVISMAGKTGGVADQAECFTYDYLRRLTQAWTETTPTCTTPQATGTDAYRLAWTFDTAGDRTNQTSYNPDGSIASASSYAYPAAGSGPHTLASVTTTGIGAGTTTYTYDPAGNTTSRPGPGGAQQTLTWDPEGHPSTVVDTTTTTSLIYDATGNRLLRHDPAGFTTLTLPDGTELRANATGSIAGTRYYGLATRTANTDSGGNLTGGDTLTWTLTDSHGTATLAINPTTLHLDRRRSLPYGQPRGPQPALFGAKGFVNGVTDPTGLTHLGAREYDPSLGRFTSLDPLLDLADPQQWNGYTYASNNPVTHADPNGLKKAGSTDESGQITFAQVDCGRYANMVFAVCAMAAEILTGMAGGGLPATLGGMKRGGGRGGGEPEFSGQGGTATGRPSLKNAAEERTDRENTLTRTMERQDSEYAQYAKAESDRRNSQNAEHVKEKFEHSDRLANTETAGCHSFDPSTAVLMADGSPKPIKDIHTGDSVTTTDPASGKTATSQVTQLHHNHDNDLTDLTVAVDGPSSRAGDQRIVTLKTTSHHPFWDATTNSWVNAADLHPGDHLRNLGPTTVTVIATHNYTGQHAMNDLTIANTHTYYVVAGDTPVLVHNCGGTLDIGGGNFPNETGRGITRTPDGVISINPNPAHAPTVVGRSQQLPFADSSFDRVTMRNFPADQFGGGTLSEVARVTQPGGTLSITTGRNADVDSILAELNSHGYTTYLNKTMEGNPWITGELAP